MFTFEKPFDIFLELRKLVKDEILYLKGLFYVYGSMKS